VGEVVGGQPVVGEAGRGAPVDEFLDRRRPVVDQIDREADRPPTRRKGSDAQGHDSMIGV